MPRKKKIKDVKEESLEIEDFLQTEELQNRQVKWIVLVAIVIMASILLAYFIVQESRKFEFVGLNFEKVKFGELLFYYSQLKIPSLSGITGEVTQDNYYDIYLRKDPRTNKIPINASIDFKQGTSFVSVEDSFRNCEDSGIALVNFARILAAMGISLKGATPEISLSTENTPYITCENKPGSTVILLKNSTITQISQDSKNKNCYILEIKNCEILEATERFVLAAIAKYNGREIK